MTQKRYLVATVAIVCMAIVGVAIACSSFFHSSKSESELKPKPAPAPKQEVIYIPGWQSKSNIDFVSDEIIESIFGTSQVSVWGWESNCKWETAKNNAEAVAAQFASEIVAMPEERRCQCILVGHSLGGRVVAKTAKILAKENIKVKQIILLGAAINCDDPDLEYCTIVSEDSFINVFNHNDNVLKLAYGNAERALPAGYCGVKKNYPNMKQFCKKSDIDNEIANIFEHYVDVYLDFLRTIKLENIQEYTRLINHHEIKFEETILSLPPNIYLTAPGAIVEDTYHEWKLCYYELYDIDIPELLGGKKTIKMYMIVSPYGNVMWNVNRKKIQKRWEDVKTQIDQQLAAAQDVPEA